MRRAAVVRHGKAETIPGAAERLQAVARSAGVELVDDDHASVDLAVVLGGDGTMLRALAQFLGTGVPVIGVNFGRVGFLASVAAEELEAGLARAFAGEFRVFELPTLEADVSGGPCTAVNDVVAHSATLGRMVELGWEVGGEDFGTLACDGVICSTPSGSTAYNLSNGGPVLAWGLDAMAVTFIAPHSLHARPLVVGRGTAVVIRNRTSDVPATVLVDGHAVGEVDAGGALRVRLGDQRSRLATLPESMFFRRYRETFAS
ncbi:MAG: NAD(+)/NADH kinase [Thermoleophilia bacterium]|nr:NAD(+)/NADH kinase [Thermoleophilia bacterium]